MLTEAQARALYAQGEEATVIAVLELQRQVVVLSDRVAELEERLNKNSRTSHKPPSSDGYGKRPSPTRRAQRQAGRKSGGQPGHPGTTLKMVAEPDHVKQIWPETCSVCRERMEAESGEVVARGQVFDVPPQRLEVTEYQVMERACPGCGTRCRGRLPEGIVPGAQYGSRIKATMTYLQVDHLLPLDRASRLLGDLLGAPVAEGTLVGALNTSAERLEPVVDGIRQALIDAGVVHFDETGMRIGGGLWWLHTAGTKEWTHYTVDPNRGRKAHARIGILPVFGGTAVHDGYASYWGYDCDHALCNAHHLRELQAVYDATGQAWAEELGALLCQAHRWKVEGRLTPKRQKMIFRRYDEILEQGRRANFYDLQTAVAQIRDGRLRRSSAQKLVHRLIRDKEATLRFVVDPDVPFENNLAERDVRMAKVKQKVSGCFRTESGAHAFYTVRSYISTVRKQGMDVLAALTAVFDGVPIMPAPT